jgi:hypothetical protein
MTIGDSVEFVLFENGDKLATNEDRILIYEVDWIVERNRETGEETSRHNLRYIASIYWKPKEIEG